MDPHRLRIVAEQQDLDAKIACLMTFLKTDVYKSAPWAEQERLKRQHDIMREYSDVLGERIEAFP